MPKIRELMLKIPKLGVEVLGRQVEYEREFSLPFSI